MGNFFPFPPLIGYILLPFHTIYFSARFAPRTIHHPSSPSHLTTLLTYQPIILSSYQPIILSTYQPINQPPYQLTQHNTNATRQAPFLSPFQKLHMKNTILLLAGIFAGVLLTAQLAFKEKKSTPETKHTWFAPTLPEQISFAGEKVPLEKWDVKERFDRQVLFNYYQPANVLFMLKMANRHFPIIEQRLKANGVPDDFKYLCVAESNLVAEAISRSGAVSFWQFLDMTAPGYNLEVSKEVDQRYDLVKSTDAACKYLKSAYNKFGTWTAAAASYNCGQGGYNSRVVFQQRSNYYDLLLPEETNRYLFRILAFKYLMENADEFGFVLEEEEAYQPIKTRTVTVSSSITNLAQFAIDNGTDYKTMQLLNPWLRSRTLTVKPGKKYEIQLPE